MRRTVHCILASCIAIVFSNTAFGQISVDSYWQYVNDDKSIERVVTFKNKGYVHVESPTGGQGYEVFFPEGPNEQKNGTRPLLVNVWIAINIREIMTKEDTACFHYYVVRPDKLLEYKCAERKQISVSINSLPAEARKELIEFRDRAKIIWPAIKFPE